MSTHRDAQRLPQELAAELAALDLPTFEARRDAIHGVPGVRGLRARYLSRLDELRRAHGHSDLLVHRVSTDIDRACAQFLIDALPPADSGRYVGYPRSI
jgi:hypothetical protein